MIVSPIRLPSPRIALYSHDTMGLGHIRRNQLIAMALAAPPLNATVLLITGVREGGAFPMPQGIDSVVLPAYRKDADGGYSSRSLNIGIDQLTRFRADLIDLALKRFQPDLFIADNVPGGALDELLPALERMRRDGNTHCVLGLRDILDDPETIRREWERRRNFSTIARLYDAIWVYGDPAVYPTADIYDFPAELKAITSYTGYLDPFRSSASRLPAQGGDVDGHRERPRVVAGLAANRLHRAARADEVGPRVRRRGRRRHADQPDPCVELRTVEHRVAAEWGAAVQRRGRRPHRAVPGRRGRPAATARTAGGTTAHERLLLRQRRRARRMGRDVADGSDRAVRGRR